MTSPSLYICARCGVGITTNGHSGWRHVPFNSAHDNTDIVHQQRPMNYVSPRVPAPPKKGPLGFKRP